MFLLPASDKALLSPRRTLSCTAHALTVVPQARDTLVLSTENQTHASYPVVITCASSPCL